MSRHNYTEDRPKIESFLDQRRDTLPHVSHFTPLLLNNLYDELGWAKQPEEGSEEVRKTRLVAWMKRNMPGDINRAARCSMAKLVRDSMELRSYQPPCTIDVASSTSVAGPSKSVASLKLSRRSRVSQARIANSSLNNADSSLDDASLGGIDASSTEPSAPTASTSTETAALVMASTSSTGSATLTLMHDHPQKRSLSCANIVPRTKPIAYYERLECSSHRPTAPALVHNQPCFECFSQHLHAALCAMNTGFLSGVEVELEAAMQLVIGCKKRERQAQEQQEHIAGSGDEADDEWEDIE